MISLFRKREVEIWDGSYMYDEHPVYSRDYEVPFAIIFSRNFFGNITGKVHDDVSKGGMKDEGKIKGNISKGGIRFIKRMPKFEGRDDLGNPLQLNIPHPLLHYNGTYNQSQNQYEGIWEIDPAIFHIKGRGSFKTGKSRGRWKMRRRN